jgi:hypothetical protein
LSSSGTILASSGFSGFDTIATDLRVGDEEFLLTIETRIVQKFPEKLEPQRTRSTQRSA